MFLSTNTPPLLHTPLNPNPLHSNHSEGVTRLVKLRNPWGKGEWKGAWSDGDHKWSPSLKRQLKVENKEDGIFFIDYNDFCKFYSDFQVCYFQDGYKYSALKVENVEKTENVFLQFQITKPGEYYFSLNQVNKRFFNKPQRYRYSNLAYVISYQDKHGEAEYVGGNMKSDKENWIGKVCRPGLYTVMIKANWRSFIRTFSFSVYGPATCQIKRVGLYFWNVEIMKL